MEFRLLTREICIKEGIEWERVPAILKDCYSLAMAKSDDPSTKVGAILYRYTDSPKGGYSSVILGGGANSFPRGVSSVGRTERPAKYTFLEHAERNAILAAAKVGYYTEYGVLFAPWFACADCARAIIQSGIRMVVGHKAMLDVTPDSWKESITNAYAMFDEAGVKFFHYDGVVGSQILINGVIHNV